MLEPLRIPGTVGTIKKFAVETTCFMSFVTGLIVLLLNSDVIFVVKIVLGF